MHGQCIHWPSFSLWKFFGLNVGQEYIQKTETDIRCDYHNNCDDDNDDDDIRQQLRIIDEQNIIFFHQNKSASNGLSFCSHKHHAAQSMKNKQIIKREKETESAKT